MPVIRPEVSAALEEGQAVVALESAVITHGLPQPQNVELALELEHSIRKATVIPATIGIVKGELIIGMSEAEIRQLASASAEKATLWNLSALLARGEDAGTTVAATATAAHRAGIRVFATGGIGGVHPRRPGEPLDESADLLALSSTPIIVVCAGAKSILDIPATLERLETLGVPVIGYRSDFFAGFYVPQTPYRVAARLESASEVSRCFIAQRMLGLQQALLISHPVAQGLSQEELEPLMIQASKGELKRGKDLTPGLLARLADLSEGQSVEVNRRLLKDNARLAAEIARELPPAGVKKGDS